jgi:hypothetical protein
MSCRLMIVFRQAGASSELEFSDRNLAKDSLLRALGRPEAFVRVGPDRHGQSVWFPKDAMAFAQVIPERLVAEVGSRIVEPGK